MMNESVLILMSTYQGEKYLAAQLDSILAQTHQNWVLLIRDDGSTDQTINIITRYQALDKRIIQLNDTHGNLKPAQSFSMLMTAALQRHEPYIFFADQDDIWISEKLAIFLEQFDAMNKQHHPSTPLLVFSDLHVVNHLLHTMHSSYLQHEKLIANTSSPINTLILHNFVTGCAMAINRALLQIAAPMPKEAIMHDWWCALCAAATGKMAFIETTTVLYRQHGNNDIGSKGFYSKFLQVSNLKNQLRRHILRFKLRLIQAEKLLERISNDNPYAKFLWQYITLPTHSFTARMKTLLTLSLKPAGILRKIWFYFLLLNIKTQ